MSFGLGVQTSPDFPTTFRHAFQKICCQFAELLAVFLTTPGTQQEDTTHAKQKTDAGECCRKGRIVMFV